MLYEVITGKQGHVHQKEQGDEDFVSTGDGHRSHPQTLRVWSCQISTAFGDVSGRAGWKFSDHVQKFHAFAEHAGKGALEPPVRRISETGVEVDEPERLLARKLQGLKIPEQVGDPKQRHAGLV